MSALNDRFRFYLTHDVDTREVFPVQDDITIQYVPEQNEWYFRTRVKNQLLLRVDDFAWAKAIEDGVDRCLPVKFEVFQKVPGAADELRFEGVTYFDDADFDEDRCEITLKVEQEDSYGALTRIWEKPINILSGTTKVSVFTNFKDCSTPLTEIEEMEDVETIVIAFPGNQTFTESGFPDAADGWVMTSDQVVVDDIGPSYGATRIARFAREITTATYPDTDPYPPGDIMPGGWKVIVTSPGFVKYCRRIASFERLSEATSQTYFFGIIPGNWTYDSYLKLYSYIAKYFAYYQNGVTLADVFTKLLSGSGISVKSNVFNINPSGASPSNDVYDDDEHHNIVIYSRSDIQNPDASDPATRLDLSLKTLLEVLKKVFQTYFVMDGTTLIVEHVSFFEGQNGIDFTVAPYDVSLIGKNKYSYDRQTIPIGEEFIQAEEEACQETFKRWSFTYEIPPNGDGIPENCITRQNPVEQTTAGDVCNDVQQQTANPDLFTTSGFTMINSFLYLGQRMIDADDFTRCANYRMTPVHLQKYWKHRRWFAHGLDSEGDYLYFQSIKKTKLQAELSVKVTDISIFDPTEQHQTNYGWGETAQAEYSLKTGIIKIQLRHE